MIVSTQYILGFKGTQRGSGIQANASRDNSGKSILKYTVVKM